ncbi:MAG: YcaO-like family protein [Bacteroidota bacterium]
MHSFHTSLRERSIEETLAYAQEYARKLGVTRVTDITRLDSLGIHVFSSIRPGAVAGTLCVNSGKGLRKEEARIGAYMEAIEFAMAEYNRAGLPTFHAPLTQVLDGASRPNAFLDLAPLNGKQLDPEKPIEQVLMMDLNTGQYLPVPAELVFMPYFHPDDRVQYGSNTNGLASGNSQDEATLHALLEVLERDVLSFYHLRPRGVRQIPPESWPETVTKVAGQADRHGVKLAVQAIDNEFGLPVFRAVLLDYHHQDPLFINGGYGCHFRREVALSRAVSEAFQSRLVYIHGGRDDLADTHAVNDTLTPEEKKAQFQELEQEALHGGPVTSISDIHEYAWQAGSSAEYLDRLKELLCDHGFDRLLRVVFTQPEEPLQVVKMVVPGLEHFNPDYQRVGRRLYAYHQELVKQDQAQTDAGNAAVE